MQVERLERRDRILDQIEQKSRVSIQELCSFLNASEATVRRDLSLLAEEGLIRRVHGGAIMNEKLKIEPQIMQRCSLHNLAKRAIGRETAKIIQEGETVFLGSGTTVLEVAKNLLARRELRVITNSLPVVNLLADVPEIQLVITGGFLRNSERSLIGFLVEKSLSELRADKVIFGVQAIHAVHGVTEDWIPGTMVDRSIISFAPELIIVADSSKFGQTRLSFVANINQAKTIVTDKGIDRGMAEEIERQGVRLIIADENQPA